MHTTSNTLVCRVFRVFFYICKTTSLPRATFLFPFFFKHSLYFSCAQSRWVFAIATFYCHVSLTVTNKIFLVFKHRRTPDVKAATVEILASLYLQKTTIKYLDKTQLFHFSRELRTVVPHVALGQRFLFNCRQFLFCFFLCFAVFTRESRLHTHRHRWLNVACCLSSAMTQERFAVLINCFLFRHARSACLTMTEPRFVSLHLDNYSNPLMHLEGSVSSAEPGWMSSLPALFSWTSPHRIVCSQVTSVIVGVFCRATRCMRKQRVHGEKPEQKNIRLA